MDAKSNFDLTTGLWYNSKMSLGNINPRDYENFQWPFPLPKKEVITTELDEIRELTPKFPLSATLKALMYDQVLDDVDSWQRQAQDQIIFTAVAEAALRSLPITKHESPAEQDDFYGQLAKDKHKIQSLPDVLLRRPARPKFND